MPKRASGVATRRSQAAASWVPAPRAAPSTAAIVTAGSSVRPVSTPRRAAKKPSHSTPVRSAPAQNVPPAPVSTSTRTCRSRASSMAARSCHQRVEVDGVAALGPVDGDDARIPSGGRHGSRVEHGHHVALLDLVLGGDAQLGHGAVERAP